MLHLEECLAVERRVTRPDRLPGGAQHADPVGDELALTMAGIVHWIGMLSAARESIRSRHPTLDREAFLEMEHEGVRLSLANLRTFPWVREREQAGHLKLHGAFFAIDNGILHVLDEATGVFAAA